MIAKRNKAAVICGLSIFLFIIGTTLILNLAPNDENVNGRIIPVRSRRQTYDWSALRPSNPACPMFKSCNSSSVISFTCTTDDNCSSTNQVCCPSMTNFQFCCRTRAPPPFSVVPPVGTSTPTANVTVQTTATSTTTVTSSVTVSTTLTPSATGTTTTATGAATTNTAATGTTTTGTGTTTTAATTTTVASTPATG